MDLETKPERSADDPGGWLSIIFLSVMLTVLVVSIPIILEEKESWWIPWALGIGGLVLAHNLTEAILGTYHRRKLSGRELSAKVGDQLGGLWFGLIKWIVICAALFGAYRAYEDHFVPASSTNKLLIIACVMLGGIFLALLHVADHMKKR